MTDPLETARAQRLRLGVGEVVMPLRRPCQIRSCPNSGKYPAVAVVGGMEVRYWLCAAHITELKMCGTA